MAQREVAWVSLADMRRMMAGGNGSEAFKKPKCAVCNIIQTDNRKLLTCGRRKKTPYCSKDCQEENRGTHKLTCKAQNYIVNISLCPTGITNPSVTRTLSCPSTATFEQLHRALQIAFGWASTHTYDFKTKDRNVQPQLLLDMMTYITRRMGQDAAQFGDNPLPDSGPRQNLLRIIEKGPMGPGSFASAKGLDSMHNRDRVHSQTPKIDSKKIKLSKVLENKEYKGAKIEYEYDFGDCWQHTVDIAGRAEASNRFLCLEGEGHSVAEDVGANQGWLKLREAYRTADPTTEQREKRTWFESGASNNDPKGLGNGREQDQDANAANANLRR